MDLNNKHCKQITLCAIFACCILTACSISYKFNGASINYDKVKTISFENFPNRSAAFVWGPMESMFNTASSITPIMPKISNSSFQPAVNMTPANSFLRYKKDWSAK